MNVKQALNILRPIEASEAGLKEAYRKASFQHHPDCGGSTELMQLVNEANKTLTKTQVWWTPLQAKQAKREIPLTEIVEGVLNSLGHLPGLDFEMVGDWLWITGETKKFKAEIKEAGLKFSRNKSAWYWHPAGYKKYSKKSYSMNNIRTMHGSETIQTKKISQIAA